MEEQEKQYQSGKKRNQEEQQTINNTSNMENREPAPNPKDYDEIEY